MGILSGIKGPADLKALDAEQLPFLAEEIRELLVTKVSATGGHLGPNLGVVELSIALHRVFDSPQEPIIFDTSHQSYVHKMLTGRAEQFDNLRKKGGLSGYTCRAESEHDFTESSHASAALSYADGLSKAFALSGRGDKNVVAVVGDGALTGGMCWEALNNIADDNRNIVVVVNDNGRSYSPTIGGFASTLHSIRANHGYDELMETGKKRLRQLGWIGDRTYQALAAMKEGIKSQLLPTKLFSDLGIKYVGPISGHDIAELEQNLRYGREYDGPIIMHVVTEKGHGFAPAVNDVRDQMHSTGVIDPITGEPTVTSEPGWTALFSDELLKVGHERKDIVAITAAMAGPTGTQAFGDEFPDRFFDVGIAEAHALTSAAGLALGGYHPVVALYSTFLNRAFDQLLMDVALLKLPTTVILDRAGVTGSDGASHNGLWDMSISGVIPGIQIAAPRDGNALVEQFREALDVDDAPTILRFPKGDLPEPIEAQSRLKDGLEILFYSDAVESGDFSGESRSILIITIGAMAGTSLKVAQALEAQGYAVTVVDPRWVIPVPGSIIELASDHDLVVSIEDGMSHGGVGTRVMLALSEAAVVKPVKVVAFPQVFPEHGSRSEILAEAGLDAESITSSIMTWIDSIADNR